MLVSHFSKFFRVLHLVVNLLVQLMLGVPLEMVQRWWRVLIVYIAGVVAGSLGTSVADPYTRLAGASGGVYAILLAHIASIIMVRTLHYYTFFENEKRMPYAKVMSAYL
jgi:membrane associated rhomboid family serine protease